MTDPERPRTTPEGHTPEEPRPGELGKSGTPGAGMAHGVPHAAEARGAEDAHTTLSDDDHGLAEPQLGPIDWPSWGYALLGVLAGLLIVGMFVMAIVGQPG